VDAVAAVVAKAHELVRHTVAIAVAKPDHAALGRAVRRVADGHIDIAGWGHGKVTGEPQILGVADRAEVLGQRQAIRIGIAFSFADRAVTEAVAAVLAGQWSTAVEPCVELATAAPVVLVVIVADFAGRCEAECERNRAHAHQV
jgi:hypothetical protein